MDSSTKTLGSASQAAHVWNANVLRLQTINYDASLKVRVVDDAAGFVMFGLAPASTSVTTAPAQTTRTRVGGNSNSGGGTDVDAGGGGVGMVLFLSNSPSH
jgi:hypothetical protein